VIHRIKASSTNNIKKLAKTSRTCFLGSLVRRVPPLPPPKPAAAFANGASVAIRLL
jgi:hypothetical protein